MADRVSFICYSRGAPQGSKRHLGNGVLVESSKRVKPFRSDLQGVAIEATPVDWDLGLQGIPPSKWTFISVVLSLT